MHPTFLILLSLFFWSTADSKVTCPQNRLSVVLRCNIPSGPLQEVLIAKAEFGLTQCELDENGSYHGFKIGPEEVNYRKIVINKYSFPPMSSPGILWFESERWFFRFPGLSGLADCWIDKLN